MELTLRVTRNTLGTLSEELLIVEDDGSIASKNPYHYPKTLNKILTGCVNTSCEYGIFTASDQPVKFYFAATPNTAPVLVGFGDLEFPAKLEPNCTPEQAESWAREYLRILARRLVRVEESRRFQLTDFSVSVTATF